MLICALTAIVGFIYLEAAVEAWREGAQWHHLAREAGLSSAYWLMAFSKYLEVAAYKVGPYVA